ncbi:non-ribosomal peptide synthetase [Streptomyces sp. 1331.2]|uniref:non-ribosomal peptide synthetase n=1 Tax=Streptomyces sp. 1331.2 TaxID=1938835 RepID=UPI000BCD7C09|nr:non-ribosomal peptide synthetase [Streptomyces sp. 1331.2]SOB88724.1 amino acid adenylation domain-containing protein [Streptomyces sp. 1331.2]
MDGLAQRTGTGRAARTYPLSPAQSRLWLLSMLNEGSPEFNVTLAWRIRGPLDTTLLRRSLATVVARHDPLRTRFPTTGSATVQLVEPEADVPWRTDDIRAVPADAREEALSQAVREEALTPFALDTAPLLRARAVQLADDDLAVVLTLHHLITDGWSTGILVDEWGTAYHALAAGRTPRFEPLAECYGDDATRRRERIDSGALQESLAWWRKRLDGVEPLELPADRPRTRQRDWHGATVDTLWQGQRFDALTAFARAHRTTLFTVLVAALKVVLSRYAGSRDIAVGLPVAGRDRTGTEDLVGLFFDTVVLRTDLSGAPTFAQLLERVQEGLLDAYDHQDVPFEQIVEALAPERDAGRTPVFQVWCEMDNTDRQDLALPGARVHEIDVPTDTAKFDLSLSVRQGSDRLELSLGYRTDLFTRATAERWQRSLEHVLTQAMTRADEPVDQLPVLPDDESRRVVELGRGPHTPPASDVLTRFEQQAAARPQAPAVVCGDRTLSYGQLDALAERIAHALHRSGANTESRIAVCLERGPELVAAFLGTWKAGAAYVPLEPAHPDERNRFVLEDTGAPVVLTQRALAHRFTHCPVEVVCLDAPDRDDTEPARPGRTARQPAAPGTLAYVIYTSGSTGRPKGVMIEHGPLANFVQSCADRYALRTAGGAALFASVAADAVVPNILTPLVLGQPLHVLPETLDLADLGPALAASGPYSFLKVTPSHLNLLTEQLTADQAEALAGVMVVGAEAFPARTLRAWRALDRTSVVLNEYGPTEATVANSLYTTQPSDTDTFDAGLLPIGVPIANTSMYVLDSRMNPVPPGAIGQIHIGGHCLARGYERRPALTADRFVPDPYSTEPGARLYATGDLGRVLADGNVHFLGRADDQVKIRGYRVEPGEVEAALARHPDVTAVHVAAITAPHGDELAAWVALQPGTTVRPGELRAWLARLLPDPMVPSHYATVDAIPLTAHGKIDRRQLPDPKGTQNLPTRPPATDAERALARIWQELLGRDTVGADDNFFSLGGTSLTGLRMITRLRNELHEQVAMRDLFENPTIAALAHLWNRPADGTAERTTPATRSLVTLKAGQDDGRKLFCVHPSGGSVHWYQPIAAVLRPEDTLLAFQLLELELAQASTPVTVASLTTRYLEELRALQPTGPYHLLGYSWSGVVALEMAAQLHQCGETVASLILVEPTLPDPYTLTTLRPIIQLHRRCARLIDDITRVANAGGDPTALRAELETVLAESELLPDAVSELTTAAPVRAAGQLFEAFHTHRPTTYPGSVDLIVTQECRAASTRQPSAASGTSYPTYLDSWRTIAQGGLTVHDAGGHHKSMLNPEHVHTVADALYGHPLTRPAQAPAHPREAR